MARDVNASINKCEKAIAQEEKNISEHFSKIKTTRSDTKNTSPFIKSVRRKQSVLIL